MDTFVRIINAAPPVALVGAAGVVVVLLFGLGQGALWIIRRTIERRRY